MITGLLLPTDVSQMQSNLLDTESTCCLQIGKLQEFMVALFALKSWSSFVVCPNRWPTSVVVVPMLTHGNFLQLESYLGASICVPVNMYITMKCHDADANVQKKEAYYDECIITLVVVMDTELMQWKNSWLFHQHLFLDIGTSFALEMVSANDKSLCCSMLLYSPCQISEQSCAIPDNCCKWLMLWGRIGNRIIILQILGGLHERCWSSKFYCRGQQIFMAVLTAMLYYIDPGGGLHYHCSMGTVTLLQATVVSDSMASMNLMVFDSFLQSVVNSCFTGHTTQGDSELMQWKIAWLFSLPLMASWFQFSPDACLAKPPESSWNCEILRVDQRLLQSSCLHGFAIHCGSEVMQWIIAWLFSLVLLESGVQYYPTEQYSVRGSEQFLWQIAWSTRVISDSSNRCAQFVCQARRCRITCGYHLEMQNTAILQFSKLHAPWDPGGSPRHWLEGKPKFKEGGLSATSYESWAGQWAAILGLGPPLALVQIEGRRQHRGVGGLELDGRGGFGRGWLGVRYCFFSLVFLLFFHETSVIPILH